MYVSYRPDWPIPSLPAKGCHMGLGLERGLDRKVTAGRGPGSRRNETRMHQEEEGEGDTSPADKHSPMCTCECKQDSGGW